MNSNRHSSGDLPVINEPSDRRNGMRDVMRTLLAQPMSGPLFALVVITFVFSVTTSTFLNVGNISLLFQQSVVVGTIALGQTLIVLVAGIDLACGAILVLGTVLIGSLAGHGDMAAIAAGLVVCLAAASLNGLVITRFKLPPFIVTLGTLTILAAASRLYTHSQSYPVSSDFLTILGSGFTSGVVTFTYGSLLWIVLTLVLSYVMNQTAWGVRVYAIGNSSSAARLNGIHVGRITFSVYALAGLFYFFAAWQALGRTPIADPSAYQTANLDAITAVVIGGTSLFGGRGGVAGTFVGALIVTVLKNGLTQAGIDSLYQQIATGILVILAVGVDHYLSRRKQS
ncbi:ABC transporter permease [Paraburkholderia megapolitana]|uniref:Fructose transport system permease protein n=1 Tax=Paraburkholderia megapolitana TaxID=420953 RepID=A0A1I3GQ37_9BURK|nr:ABC transporter permease [Paraburkholderia megapolitana]SFI25615.1 fructose transport system permease protein [Paraburkholderia megapolitana]